MARRVVLHVGLPKTGTTYLQSIAWQNRDVLRGQGVLLPGFGSRQHLWASCVVREEPRIRRRHPDAPEAWATLLAQARAWPGTVLISHEFFSGASEEQVRRALEDLGDVEVHVVVTAREIVGLLTARWQEWVKNGATGSIDGYPPREASEPQNEWGWATLDLADVLRRWGSTLPSDRVHLITLPGSDEPRDALWARFAGVIGIDPESCDTSVSRPNESLGVAEVELLRRINGKLRRFRKPVDKGVYIRGYLAQRKLVPRGGERFWPSPDRVAELRSRGNAGIDEIRARGYHVVGDLADLVTPDELPERRHPDTVSDAELLDAATATIAEMLTDLRQLRRRTRRRQRPRTRSQLLLRRLRTALRR